MYLFFYVLKKVSFFPVILSVFKFAHFPELWFDSSYGALYNN